MHTSNTEQSKPTQEPTGYFITNSKEELEARVEEVELFKTTFVTRAIPETNEYANGWNEYRKVVRADVDRIADHRIKKLTNGEGEKNEN